MLERITNITAYISNIIGDFKPQVAIVIGSGLAKLSESVEVAFRISYKDIPQLPHSTVEGHKGEFIFGSLEGCNVVVMNGRFHYYEGYEASEVVCGIRIFKMLGVEKVLLSNAAGALNSSYCVGDIMVITDHISFIPNPLVGANIPAFGERFPSLTRCYSPRLIKIARESKLFLHYGVYVALTGPSYETDSEVKFLRTIGGDCVGMSTAPEVIAAAHCSMEVFAASLVTNVSGSEIAPTHAEVVAAGEKGSERMEKLFRAVLKESL